MSITLSQTQQQKINQIKTEIGKAEREYAEEIQKTTPDDERISRIDTRLHLLEQEAEQIEKKAARRNAKSN